MSISNRALRMAQHHVRNRADAQLNLIPLIDILGDGGVPVGLLDRVEVIQNSRGSNPDRSRRPRPSSRSSSW
jgi:hypothetical protein